DDAELLAHLRIDTAHGTALNFNVDAAAAAKIANAARIDPDVVRSLTVARRLRSPVGVNFDGR
ncbi:MAG: hypothetical protein ACRC9K_15600, partial [Afipia sp.]